MSKVIVGMSGGVDSTVTAYLLKLAGYHVTGVTLRTWDPFNGKTSRCCEIDSAQMAADKLDIPYYVVNCMRDFDEQVIQPFIDEYIGGRTPNPCIPCNRYIKWGKMLEAADRFGAEYIATGHYASLVQNSNGRYTLQQADNAAKDQTYMLYRLTQEQLKRTIMPLGRLTKSEVRKIAHEAGLPGAETPDSQEICFVPDGDHGSFIEENCKEELLSSGSFLDSEGNVLGTHKGVYRYTVGQRRGLGLALGKPVYVSRVDGVSNSVILGEESTLYKKSVYCKEVCFMGIEDMQQGEKLTARVKIRYNHIPQRAVLEKTCGDGVRIDFDEPVRAAAAGQSAVFYDDKNRVIGGGVIT